jgi:CheY-like chemotaxis protein
MMELNMGESNINEQINYIITFFKIEVEGKAMKLSFNNALTSDESIIITDREKIFAVLTSLLENAVKYSDKGSIELGYSKKGDYLQFYVKDTGIGIPEDRLDAIFERFIQVDYNDIHSLDGAGLGLSISRAYVEMLGGKIWAESEVKKGSTFYFTLPYLRPAIDGDFSEKEYLQAVEDIKQKKVKTLIVEDDEISEMLLSCIVKDISSQIIIARTGKEAVKAFRENPEIDLILMDIQMPEMNGYESTEQIRKVNKDVIIIAQTAFGLDGDKKKVMDAGFNDYIVKPIKKDLLIEIIRKYF